MTTFFKPYNNGAGDRCDAVSVADDDAATLAHVKTQIDLRKLSRPPSAWYYIGPEKMFGTKPRGVSPWGKPLLIYRVGEKLVVQHRHCVHMNTDLTKGKVVNGRLVCPMHVWKFDDQGNCTDVPGLAGGECHLILPSYHVHVVDGHVFAYSRPKSVCREVPSFPEFRQHQWEEFEMGPAIDFYSDTPWYMVTANGFDVSHFEFVHGRTPVAPSEMKVYAKNHCGIQHQYENTSNTWFDRIIRRLMGKQMSLDFDVFDGNMILSKTQAAGKSSYMCSNVQPIDEESCRISIFPLVKKTDAQRQFFLTRFIIRVLRRFFIKQFFMAELRSIKSVRLKPQSLMQSDLVVAKYFSWLSQPGLDSNSQGEDV